MTELCMREEKEQEKVHVMCISLCMCVLIWFECVCAYAYEYWSGLRESRWCLGIIALQSHSPSNSREFVAPIIAEDHARKG